MIRIAPSEKDIATGTLEQRLWDAAAKAEFQVANCEFQSVRQSKFVIQHCPAPHDATGRFDFVLANPPFNVNAVDKQRLRSSLRVPRRWNENDSQLATGNSLTK